MKARRAAWCGAAAAGWNARSSRSSGCATSCRATASTSRAWAARTSRISSTTGCSRSPGDIFRLPKRVDEIRKREGWGDLSVRNLRGRDRGAQDDRARPLHQRARHPADRRGDGQDPGAGIRRRRHLACRDAGGREGAQEAARRREEGKGRGRGRPELRPAVQRRADRRHDGRRDVRLLQRRPQRRDHRGPAQAAHRRGA